MARGNVSDRGVTVDRALDADGKKISVTKTAAGRRFIDLNQTTLDLLAGYMAGPVDKNPHDLVFPTSKGSWVSTNNWRRRGFMVACEKAGLVDVETVDGKEVEVPRYKPYDLRHFYATYWPMVSSTFNRWSQVLPKKSPIICRHGLKPVPPMASGSHRTSMKMASMPLSTALCPLLQERGLFHQDYEGKTLRDHIGAPDQLG